MSWIGFDGLGDAALGKLAATGLSDVLDDATLRLVPLRIFLFGSAVRGTMSPDSDLDFLVVVPEGNLPALLRATPW